MWDIFMLMWFKGELVCVLMFGNIKGVIFLSSWFMSIFFVYVNLDLERVIMILVIFLLFLLLLLIEVFGFVFFVRIMFFVFVFFIIILNLEYFLLYVVLFEEGLNFVEKFGSSKRLMEVERRKILRMVNFIF